MPIRAAVYRRAEAFRFFLDYTSKSGTILARRPASFVSVEGPVGVSPGGVRAGSHDARLVVEVRPEKPLEIGVHEILSLQIRFTGKIDGLQGFAVQPNPESMGGAVTGTLVDTRDTGIEYRADGPVEEVRPFPQKDQLPTGAQ